MQFERLGDRMARSNSDSCKRVFRIRNGRRTHIVTLWTDSSASSVTAFRRNIDALKLLAERRLHGPRLVSVQEQSLLFVATDVGRQLDEALACATAAEQERLGAAAAQAVWNFAALNMQEQPYREPPMAELTRSRLQEHRRAGATASGRKVLERALLQFERLATPLQPERFRYGNGRADEDVINLAVDARQRVALIDFDQWLPSIDPFYGFAYSWQTLDRAGAAMARARAAFLEALPWSEERSQERFITGWFAHGCAHISSSATGTEARRRLASVTARLDQVVDALPG